MTNYYNYRISPGAAYESFNDLERFHIFVEQNGFAYERIFDKALVIGPPSVIGSSSSVIGMSRVTCVT